METSACRKCFEWPSYWKTRRRWVWEHGGWWYFRVRYLFWPSFADFKVSIVYFKPVYMLVLFRWSKSSFILLLLSRP